MMLPCTAPVLLTSDAGNPLYICSSTNTWHRASMCDVAIPWNATPTKSPVDSSPRPGSTQSSPARTMRCSAGRGFSGDGSTGSSCAQLTVSPACTAAAAARRRSLVMRLSAPASSAGPQRPQFFTDVKISRIRSLLTDVSATAAICSPRGSVSTTGAVTRSGQPARSPP
jgi:hypothetical protein